MGKIYVGQTDLKISLELKSPILDTDTALIKYKKPDGSSGSFTAEKDSLEFGIISFSDFQSNSLDQSGEWTFWAHITNLAGKVVAGEPSCLIIYEEGT